MQKVGAMFQRQRHDIYQPAARAANAKQSFVSCAQRAADTSAGQPSGQTSSSRQEQWRAAYLRHGNSKLRVLFPPGGQVYSSHLPHCMEMDGIAVTASAVSGSQPGVSHAANG